MNALLLFVSTFGLVFALGLQSLNVNGGHRWAAFFTSFGIGLGNLVVLKLAPDAGPLEIAAYMAGGPLGIVASMAAHQHIRRAFHAYAFWRQGFRFGRAWQLTKGARS